LPPVATTGLHKGSILCCPALGYGRRASVLSAAAVAAFAVPGLGASLDGGGGDDERDGGVEPPEAKRVLPSRPATSPQERAERGSYVGCIAPGRSGALKGRIRGRLEAAGFEQISVEFTHPVADGMHGAIVKAVKTSEPERKGLPVVAPAARSACC
jgi:hypothetical protein